MNINKSKPKFVLFLFFIFCFAGVCLHADSGKRSLFAGNSGPFIPDHSSVGQYFPGNEQSWRQDAWAGISDLVPMVLAGVAGNLVGIIAGIGLGSSSYQGMLLGGIAGSAGGSALGVYIAGSSHGRRGNFGSALLGSLLGELAASALALVLPRRGDSEFAFLPGFLILPPIGAAILFNRSLNSRSFQAGNGLFNLAEGRLGLAVPDIQVRPVPVSGKSNKTEFGFRVNVLSVEL
ncbi:MAG: hypothetical protein MUP71_12450 [Candidatus Aminicenantes bacterium]|nr:hypothetical protein [Candidatus Aminicenantes bacterium]